MNYYMNLAYGNFWFIVPNLIPSFMKPSSSQVNKLKVITRKLFPLEIIHRIATLKPVQILQNSFVITGYTDLPIRLWHPLVNSDSLTEYSVFEYERTAPKF